MGEHSGWPFGLLVKANPPQLEKSGMLVWINLCQWSNYARQLLNRALDKCRLFMENKLKFSLNQGGKILMSNFHAEISSSFAFLQAT